MLEVELGFLVGVAGRLAGVVDVVVEVRDVEDEGLEAAAVVFFFDGGDDFFVEEELVP